jgi:uncharacterized protein (TIGR00369 family)
MANKFFGVVVPFLNLLGVRGERFDAGQTTVVLEPRPDLTNHFGSVHGGALATLLDVAMASAARSLHPEDGAVTVNMTMNFLREGSGRLSAAGRVRQSGRSLVFCEAEVLDEAGHLVATASGTFKVRRKQPATDA